MAKNTRGDGSIMRQCSWLVVVLAMVVADVVGPLIDHNTMSGMGCCLSLKPEGSCCVASSLAITPMR